MNKNIVFVGCGQIAARAAISMKNHGAQVLGIRRNIRKLPETIPSVAADVLKPANLAILRDSDADTLVYSLSANGFNEDSYKEAYITGLQNTINACNFSKLKRLIFVSSTAVYHQNDNSVVNENSPTNPQRFNGEIMLQAEKLASSTGVGTVLRFSGIYGPGRLRLIDRVKNGQCTPDHTIAYTNRIHVEDCAEILSHLIALESAPKILLGSDSKPATSVEVETFIANELGIGKNFTDTSTTQVKRIAGSKKCDNRLLLESGYHFKYADYRTGYRQLIADLPA